MSLLNFFKSYSHSPSTKVQKKVICTYFFHSAENRKAAYMQNIKLFSHLSQLLSEQLNFQFVECSVRQVLQKNTTHNF